MKKRILLFAVPIAFTAMPTFADVPPWRDYWGEITGHGNPPEDWELHIVDKEKGDVQRLGNGWMQ